MRKFIIATVAAVTTAISAQAGTAPEPRKVYLGYRALKTCSQRLSVNISITENELKLAMSVFDQAYKRMNPNVDLVLAWNEVASVKEPVEKWFEEYFSAADQLSFAKVAQMLGSDEARKQLCSHIRAVVSEAVNATTKNNF